MMKSCSSGEFKTHAFHHYHNLKSKAIKISNDGGESEIFKNNKSEFISNGNIKYKGELNIMILKIFF